MAGGVLGDPAAPARALRITDETLRLDLPAPLLDTAPVPARLGQLKVSDHRIFGNRALFNFRLAL